MLCVGGDGSVGIDVKHKPRCTVIGNELDMPTFLDRDDFCHLKLRASLQDDSTVWNCIWQTCHFYHCDVNSNFVLCTFGRKCLAQLFKHCSWLLLQSSQVNSKIFQTEIWVIISIKAKVRGRN